MNTLSTPSNASLDHLERDYLLLKLVLEGQEFKEAQKDLAKLRDAGSPLAPNTTQATASEVSSLELDVLEIRSLDARITTPDTQIAFSYSEVRHVHIQAAKTTTSPKDPLLLDLDGNGAGTTGPSAGRLFDLNGDGRTEQVSWVNGRDALLALDRNGNGQIDSGLELFGDQHGAADGFEELAKFDTDKNRLINAKDPVYHQLSLLYGDGALKPLSESGLSQIHLDSTPQNQTNASGDVVFSTSRSPTDRGENITLYAMGLHQLDLQA